MIARWRLQMIAELGVGRLSRLEENEQDAQVEQLARVMKGR